MDEGGDDAAIFSEIEFTGDQKRRPAKYHLANKWRHKSNTGHC